jgi:tagatose 6-phosphate kinase
MILAVVLNPALDLTYELAKPLRVGGTNRVAAVYARPGGKALNVARVLTRLGRTVTVIGPCGGATGRRVAAAAAEHGVDARWMAITGETRRTVAIWDRHGKQVTMLNEPGPTLAAAEWQSLLGAVEAAALPPGVPDDAYATLTRLGSARGALTFVDTDGPGLLPAVAAQPSLVKLNREELAALTHTDDMRAGAMMLRDHGAEAVVASDGSRGLLGVTPTGAWWARPPVVERGNPTGAGDAALAGLVTGSLDGRPWPDRLRQAAAWGAAAAGTSVAGEIGSLEQLEHVTARTVLEEV